MEVYSVRELSFSYPHSDKKALDEISLSVSEGEFVVLCGLSGSGKSTLLRMLKAPLSPHGRRSGAIDFFGKPLSEYDDYTQAQKIGFVLQSPDNQSVTDTVLHELAFGLENLGVSPVDMKKRIAEISSFLGLEGILHREIHTLSGGKRQIMNLASAMILQPDVLILDEPCAQLDPVGAEEFITVLTKLNREFGTAVIMSEHDPERVFTSCGRILVMSEGKIVSDGSPQETVQQLYDTDSPLFGAVPLSARVYAKAEHTAENAPLDIPSGRQWLKGRKAAPVPDTAPPQKGAAIVTLDDVFFSYDRKTDVLRGVNLSVREGEILSLIGGNGAGKTTILHTLAGVNKPYSGKARYGDNGRPAAALLPQDPRLIFSCERLYDDLAEAEGGTEEAIRFVSSLCRVDHLLERHPYDLSGGEQQRAALAKAVISRPALLLLDEPVKGLDLPAKAETGRILRRLASAGMTIVLATHDMDFAAEFSDRCSLIFDGCAGEALPPRRFFCESAFYTTSARRLSRGIIDGCITENDLLKSLGADIPSDSGNDGDGRIKKFLARRSETPSPRKQKKASPARIVSLSAFILFILSAALSVTLAPSFGTAALILGGGSALAFALLTLISDRFCRKKATDMITVTRLRHPLRLTLLSLVCVAAAVPLTIFAGYYFLDDTKYLFISLMIMAECMIPFFAVFEKRMIKTRELVLIAVMCSLCVLGRAAFYMLPEFKPVTAVVIIAGAALGAQAGFLTGAVGMLASNMIFGQGPWTPWQMFAMGLIGFLAGVFFGRIRNTAGKSVYALFGFFVSVVIYGGIMDPAAILMSRLEFTPETVAAYYLTGIPLDIIHGISTAVFLFLCASPMIRRLERIKLKYGIV